MEKIKIGILGYGNLGKGVEKAVYRQDDMELTGIYSRRNLEHPLYKPIQQLDGAEEIDVLILCGGSATDLLTQTPQYANRYHVVDSFDYHQEIQNHYRQVDAAARAGGKLALISCGWDPGLFSMMRSIFCSILPDGKLFTFWGKGISQGHSDAIRRIKGVKDARQYTIPMEHAIKDAEEGILEFMSPTAMHRRECFVVVEEDADQEQIEREIKKMPGYFLGYETTVNFISQETLNADHCRFPHGGRVLTREEGVLASFQLAISSNPDFTAMVIIAYARAIHKMAKQGHVGCRTMLEIPVKNLMGNMFMHM